MTIPGTLFATYIILGIALIGREIENPFGDDVNDLPLDSFCQDICRDIDVITSKRAPRSDEWVTRPRECGVVPAQPSWVPGVGCQERGADPRGAEGGAGGSVEEEGGGEVACRERGGLKEWWWP